MVSIRTKLIFLPAILLVVMLVAYLFFNTSINKLQESLVTLNKTNYIVNLLLKTSRENRDILVSKDKGEVQQLEEINNAILIINNEVLDVLHDEHKKEIINHINSDIKHLTKYYYEYNNTVNINRELIAQLDSKIVKITKKLKKVNKSIQRSTLRSYGKSNKEEVSAELVNLFAINRLFTMIASIEKSVLVLNSNYSKAQVDRILTFVKSAKEFISFISSNIKDTKNQKLILSSLDEFNIYKTNIDKYIENKYKETESSKKISTTLNNVSTALTGVLQEIDSQLYEEVEYTNILMIVILTIITLIVVVLSIILAKQINRSLKNIVLVLTKSGKNVKESSFELGDSSTKLADVIEEQNRSIDNINSAIVQTLSKIESNTKNTANAHELSNTINDYINENHDKMRELTGSIDNISSSSEEIKNITKTIDDLAFQINLLSLNAAVEAARAGEHGLGFAVVADEVKSLANKSSEALKQIDTIVNSSTEYVKQGVKLTNDTYSSFNDMVKYIKEISTLIENINISSKEQTQEVEHIKTSIQSIDGIRDSILEQSSNTSKISTSINNLSDDMIEIIDETKKTIGEKDILEELQS
jgi:uncharacterized coiled-coil DUF342 family protein